MFPTVDSVSSQHEKPSDVVWMPIRYVTLHFRDWSVYSFTLLQKLPPNHHSYVWTESLSGMVLVQAQKLS